MGLEKIGQILKKHNRDESALIAILQDIQAEENYLPQDVLKHVAKSMDVPLTRVYSLATFYKAFSLKPRGKHLINVCLGTACHVRGAPRILEKLERDLRVKAGETTEDKKFTLETVNCLGACALGPIVVVDGTYHGQMTSVKIGKVLAKVTEDSS